jgi:hypothetical protein
MENRIMSVFKFAAILGALAWLPPLFRIIKNFITTPEIRCQGAVKLHHPCTLQTTPLKGK